MALLATGSVLVAGSSPSTGGGVPMIKTYCVTRAFYFQGKMLKVGEIVTLPQVFAMEMCAAKKAEPCAEPQPAVSPAPEPTPEPKIEPQPEASPDPVPAAERLLIPQKGSKRRE
jgi:hypothetical protein